MVLTCFNLPRTAGCTNQRIHHGQGGTEPPGTMTLAVPWGGPGEGTTQNHLAPQSAPGWRGLDRHHAQAPEGSFLESLLGGEPGGDNSGELAPGEYQQPGSTSHDPGPNQFLNVKDGGDFRRVCFAQSGLWVTVEVVVTYVVG